MARNSYEQIKRFVLDHLVDHVINVNTAVAEKFDISRQAASQHITRMAREGLIVCEGPPRNRTYRLVTNEVAALEVPLSDSFEEHVVWEAMEPKLPAHSKGADSILFYAATEMLNNANDHSEGSRVWLWAWESPTEIRITIQDDGVGIFQKIARECHLENEHHAVLELSKGKLTTAPDRHTGEGIFFTSRACDLFQLSAGNTTLFCMWGSDFLFQNSEPIKGTRVTFGVRRDTQRSMDTVFDQYANVDEGFSRTKIPVNLAIYGKENLVSRSQAKRVLARVDRFKEVLLDFKNVEQIGQAFADEMFRVFPAQHPEVKLTPIRMRAPVRRMMQRVLATKKPDGPNIA